MGSIVQKLLRAAIKIVSDLMIEYGKPAIDAGLDVIEKRYFNDDSARGKMIMLICGVIRDVVSVPDDDSDQGDPV